MTPQIFRPDERYFQALSEKIVRLSKRSPDEIACVDINCGSGVRIGWVILKNGERIAV